MFATAQANTSVGTAFTYADEQLPSWALLGEYDNGSAKGAGRSEYIWLPTEDGGATPVGMYRNSKFFAVHADHLGTPRLVTNDTNTPVWQWPYSAFGNNKPTGILKATANPKAAVTNQPVLLRATAATEFNLRFPGQHADDEAGQFYNYFRTYQPGQGRYTQNDSIGLDGGLNRFGYVEGNPLLFTDPMGLMGNGASGARSSPINKGKGGPPVDYFQLGYTGPAIGASITIDRFGNIYFGVQTGSVTPLPSGQACFGRVLGDKPLSERELRDFLEGAGGQASFGQFGMGGGVAFSGGRTAAQVSVGTPQFPGQGAAGYNWRFGGSR
jgi:RHS repeat-associated protein